MRDKVAVSVVLQRKSDQARSRTIHNHDDCVYDTELDVTPKTTEQIELYALVNPKLK